MDSNWECEEEQETEEAEVVVPLERKESGKRKRAVGGDSTVNTYHEHAIAIAWNAHGRSGQPVTLEQKRTSERPHSVRSPSLMPAPVNSDKTNHCRLYDVSQCH